MLNLKAVLPSLRTVSRAGSAPLALAILSALLFVGCGAGAGSANAPESTRAANIASAETDYTVSDFRVRSELVFSTRADLSFQLPGEVGSVNVAVGDLVSAGDVLATLDSDTVTNLRHAEALAEFKVEDTQDKLESVLGLQSADPLIRARAENALAQAENALAQAEVALENSEDALEDYQLDHEVALSAAVQRVADATAALDRAEEAVTDFADAHGQQFANALAARALARTALEAARDAVSDFLPDHDDSISKLQNTISKTELALDRARESLRDFDKNHADRLSTARQNLAQAETRRDNAQDRLDDFYVKIVNEEFHNLRDGQNFDVVQLNALQAAVDAEQRAVDTLKRDIAELEAGPKEIDRVAIETNIAELESTLTILNRDLTDALAGPDQEELARLETNILVAQERLNTAERDLAEVEQGVDQIELARLETAVDTARVALESAQSRLERLEEGPDEATVAALTQAVATRTQAVTTARETREDLAAGPDLAAVALAQANIADALVDYADVQEDLEDTVIRAPFDGLVRMVTIESGDAIRVDARVIQLVDPTDVIVEGLLETNHIDRVNMGTPASVILAALPGVTFDAAVVSISQDARTERGVISFPVNFSVVIPEGVEIPPNPGLVTTTVITGDAPPSSRPDARPGGGGSGRPNRNQ